ncbi:MAG: DNA-binding response regulator [Bacteroidetes bacterium]|nr:MAG: DNA-binding response regulator [Bacteroidota bacterium]
MNYRVLLIEDEEHLREAIKLNLVLEGYDVFTANDGRVGLETFAEKRFDIIVLDIMLPEIDGFQVCQTIRLTDTEMPILILSAKGSSNDKVKGLKLGADDYLAKPFNLEELLLRISKLLKRSEYSSPISEGLNIYEFGGNKINFKSFAVSRSSGKSQSLSKREIMLLKLLIERKNEVVSRDEILEKVWGYDAYPSTRTIDNYILAFRKYFEKDPKKPSYFISIRGVGYKFSN